MNLIDKINEKLNDEIIEEGEIEKEISDIFKQIQTLSSSVGILIPILQKEKELTKSGALIKIKNDLIPIYKRIEKLVKEK